MRSVRLYSILACIALVFSTTGTSLDNLYVSDPDNSNLFLDETPSDGLFSSDPTVPDDSALLHSTPLSDASNDNNLLQSNLLADPPDGLVLPDDPTLLAANAPNTACMGSSPKRNRLRARQTSQTSCPNIDGEGEGLGATKTMVDEEVKKHWCPETNAPFAGFGNIPVCSRKVTDAVSLPQVYYPFIENVELITTITFNTCPLKNVWCCNIFLENLGYFEEVSILYPDPMVPPGTGYWCVKGYKKVFSQNNDPLDLASLPS